MPLPIDFIERLKAANPIAEVMSSYVTLKRTGRDYVCLCPFHNEKTPSCHIHPDKEYFHCFGCGAGGNVYNFIMEYENYSFGEALSHLADRAGVELPKIEYSREVREKAEQRAELLEINKQAAQYFIISSAQKRGSRDTSILPAAVSARRPYVSLDSGIQINLAVACISSSNPKDTVMSGSVNRDCSTWMNGMECMISSGTGLFFRSWMSIIV